MYPHLTRQNPTYTHQPVAYDVSKRHPAFRTSQPMMPMMQQRHCPTHCSTIHAHQPPTHPIPNAPVFDASTQSPIFYGYVDMNALPPLNPKL